MFSQVNNGLANGYLNRNTIDPAIGPFIAMSALPPKADIAECVQDVHFVPKADSRSAAINARLTTII